jgi:hypothetical protein
MVGSALSREADRLPVYKLFTAIPPVFLIIDNHQTTLTAVDIVVPHRAHMLLFSVTSSNPA